MSNLLQKGAVFEFLAPIVAERLNKSVSKSIGLHAFFRKIAIMFDLSKRVPLLSFTPYRLLFTLRLFTYPYNLRIFFQREPAFQFSNQVNFSTALTSSKELLLRNSTKTATFNWHAKSSLVKNDTSWHDTDSCCVADVGVS